MKILVVFVTCFFIAEGFFFATDYKNVTRLKRQTSKCKLSEYKCKSGECVHDVFFCDGKEDCTDGSDETTSCSDSYCPPHVFRCAYGACIRGDAKCDGNKDCRDNSDEAPSICKRDAHKPRRCDKGQYRCNDGQCIDDSDQCDGIDTCADGSDESVKNCANIRCPAFSFQCAYGACIRSELWCNGVKNCKDGSDERGCEGTPVIPTPWVTQPKPSKVPTGDDCLLPPYPEYGKWALLDPSILQPGEIVKANTVLTFSCNKNYMLMPNMRLSLCKKNWSIIPTCIKTCPTLPKRTILIISCSLDGGSIPCDNPYDGAKATVKCADLYEDPSFATKPYRFCRNGTWDYPLPNCESVQRKTQPIINIYLIFNNTLYRQENETRRTLNVDDFTFPKK